MKVALVDAVGEAERGGMAVERACAVIGLPRRRWYRWRDRIAEAAGDRVAALTERKRGPQRAPHALLPEERETIAALASQEPFAGLSAPKMAVMLARENRVHVSARTVGRVVRAAGLSGVRRQRRSRHAAKPEAPAGGPNQVWRFDLTYVQVVLVWMYVVFIVDAFSRKIVGWRFTADATSREVRKTFEQALLAEGLLEAGQVLPTMVSDRGPQMRAKSLREFFRDLGAAHLFSRPHVPTDNAIAEATIGCFKIEGPGFDRFPDALTGEHEVAVWVETYNQRRLHGGIGYVTPEEEHTGRGEALREARKQALRVARARRLEVNRAKKDAEVRAA